MFRITKTSSLDQNLVSGADQRRSRFRLLTSAMTPEDETDAPDLELCPDCGEAMTADVCACGYTKPVVASFTAQQRRDLAKQGEAMPDGSFPIRNKADLKDAIRLAGQAHDPEKARAWIKKRARELDAEDMIPETWLTAAGFFDESKHPRVQSGQRGGGRFAVKGNAAGRFEVVDQDSGKKVAETTDAEGAQAVAEEKNAATSAQEDPHANTLTRLRVVARDARAQGLTDLADDLEKRADFLDPLKSARARLRLYGPSAGIDTTASAVETQEPDPEMDALIAAIPVNPPSDWFFMDEPFEPTPMTVTDEGLVYGHAAIWGTCHLGNPRGAGVCVQPPQSRTDYGLFHLGELQAADGERVSVGQITLDTGHAPVNGASARTAAAHYDDTGTSVADVRATNGELGIWYSGALRPDVTAEQVRKMRAAKISGDWRGGELVGMLCVNVPGFPVPRTQARIVASADGSEEVMALVAAGIVGTQRSDRDMQIEVAVLAARAEGGIDGLAELAAS